MDRINSTVDELQRRFEILSPAPRIAMSLQALVAEENINPDEIIALIRLEPLLAARVLREANQLPEARARGYASIEDAVTAIGFQRMYDLLGLYACQYTSDAEHAPYSYSTERWKLVVTCAACMESLADKHHLDPQEAYTLGLLHSLADSIMDSESTLPPRQRSASLLGSLNERLKSFNSAGLSYTLFRDWHLPQRFIDPVRFQFSPLDCQTTGKLACLLNLSKWITGVIRETDELPDQAYGPDILVLNLLGEGEQTLWNLVTEVSERLHLADSLLQGKPSSADAA